MDVAGYYRTLMKQPNFKYPVGVSMVVESPHNFTPTPNHAPAEIAYFQGVDSRRRGLPAPANASTEWLRGYNEGDNNPA